MLFLCAVEDVSDLWETVKGNLETRVPFKKASLNNKARNLVLIDKLSVEFIQSTDLRLHRGLLGEDIPLPLEFHRLYVWVILVTCEVNLLQWLYYHNEEIHLRYDFVMDFIKKCWSIVYEEM